MYRISYDIDNYDLKYKENKCHEEKTHHLDFDSAYLVVEINSEPVAGNCKTCCHNCLKFCNFKSSLISIFVFTFWEILFGYERLEEGAAVENNINKKPCERVRE